MNGQTLLVTEMLNRAFQLHQNNQLVQAEPLYKAVLQMAPGHPDALHLLGVLESDRGRDEIAVSLIGQAIRSNPMFAEACLNMGRSLRRLKRYDEALATYDQALVIAPDFVDAHFNRGNLLQDMRRFDDAYAAYRKAIDLQPDFAEAINNCASLLWKAGRFAEALPVYERVLKLAPDYVDGWINLANTHEKLGHTEDALSCYLQAGALAPDNANAQWGESHCRLMLGDFTRGWALYESRWRGPLLKDFRAFSEPLWQGEMGLTGQTILLHAEQGLGDTLQFCRYASLVAGLGAKVILEVPASLVTLLRSLTGLEQIVACGDDLPPFDIQCPLGSLPKCFSTTLDTVPTHIPYLGVDDQKIAWWQEKLGPRVKSRVGIVWATTTPQNTRRIPLEYFLPLADMGVVLFCLQKDIAEQDRDFLARTPAVQCFEGKLKDFSDTAALISLMDVVISIDTSVAHLAGAMGKPTWVLLQHVAEWRWMKERNDSPWYPTARLFRQLESGDWVSVLARVAEELGDLGQ